MLLTQNKSALIWLTIAFRIGVFMTDDLNRDFKGSALWLPPAKVDSKSVLHLLINSEHNVEHRLMGRSFIISYFCRDVYFFFNTFLDNVSALQNAIKQADTKSMLPKNMSKRM